MSIEIIRSFIAIELPEALKADLTQLISSLKTNRQDWIKWVNPDSTHLTLKFLGDIATDKIEEILMAVKESVQGIPPFSLQINRMGVFPDLKKIQVIWVGLTGDLEALKTLQQNIENNLEILGYPVEGRKFTPHLTLGRVRYAIPSAEQPKFTEQISKTRFESTHRIEVNSVNLIKSQLTPRGAIYTKIGSVELITGN
jgi:RNA 2',3'-cyclic 3'-phosphodiesterase